MKIIFLGTGSALPTTDRNCQSVAVEQGGFYYIFDCGAPLAERLVQNGIPLHRVKAVFLSHIHRDHVSGLLTFLCLRAFDPSKTPIELFTPSESWANALVRLVQETAPDKIYDPNVVRVRLQSEGEIYVDGGICVTAYPTKHQQAVCRPTYAYQIQADEKRAFITGDLLPDASDFPKAALALSSNAVVTELHHYSPEILFPILQKCPTERALIIHIDECNREPYERAIGDFPAEADKKNCQTAKGAVKAIAPKDGDVFLL